MERENWKDIIGYEGIYQISCNGLLRSLDRIILRKNKIPVHFKGQLLKASVCKNGYLVVSLWKNGEGNSRYIHRLVAETFIPNPSNLTEINHKDEVKTNNNVTNLEWCNKKYNNNYATRNKRLSQSLINNKKTSKKIAQYSKDNKLLKIWSSCREIERVLRIPNTSVWRVCNGIRKSSHGFLWRYYND